MDTRIADHRALNIWLWAAQWLLAVFYMAAGLPKLVLPMQELPQLIPWTADYSEAFVRGIGMVDLAGGLGVLLPALTRILPRLTVLAALGCTLVQVFAIVFHLVRDEAEILAVNLPALALSLFVLWGRGRRLPIEGRRASRSI